MACETKINTELGFIDIVFKGTITQQDSTNSIVEALALASGDGPHMFLTDVLNAESELSIADIYGVPSQWEAMGASRANKLAFVAPKGERIWEDAQFYVTTARNQGWQVELFSQRQKAIKWLTSKHTPSKPDAGHG